MPNKREVEDVLLAGEGLAGGGEMGERVRDFDWSSTPLGPIEEWPQSLKTAVRILLTSRFPMWLAWGPELTSFYNDTYRHDTLGEKHPWALGKPFAEIWAETWDDLRPLIDQVLETGVATWDESLLLFLERSGYPEETYFTFSYSPLTDDDGQIAGLFAAVMEETERVLNARRLATLRALGTGLASAHTKAEVLATARHQLSKNDRDLPFTLTYLFEEDGGRARLASSTGFEGSATHAAAPTEVTGAAAASLAPATIAPAEIETAAADAVWPAREVWEEGTSVMVDDLEARFPGLPTGAWDRPPTRATLVPIPQKGQERPIGFLVVGLNPYRPYDADFTGFVELVAGQIASSLANIHAFELERRHTEALQAEGERELRRLEKLFEQVPAAILFMLGPTHVCKVVNPTVKRLIFGGRDVVGKPIREAIPEAAGQGFFEVLDEVYRTGEPFVASEWPIHLDRGDDIIEERILDFTYQPVFDNEGVIYGILSFAVDVTEKVQARMEAEEANRIKSAFLASMSHELRTPLNAILGYWDLLDAEVTGPLNAEQKEQLGRIDAAARHLLRIIEEILTFSRVEAGEEQVSIEVVDFGALARETVGMIEPLAASKQLEFSSHVPERLEMETDPGKVQQILLNLLSNAVKFTDEGSVRLDVEHREGEVWLRVSDTGIGIRSEEQERIFEPFSQVDGTYSERESGTGLGLAITRNLAELLGGSVGLQSAPGEGSTFTVRLPDRSSAAQPSRGGEG